MEEEEEQAVTPTGRLAGGIASDKRWARMICKCDAICIIIFLLLFFATFRWVPREPRLISPR